MAIPCLKYKAADVPAELHIYSNAKHGFGYRPNATPTAVSKWPERLTEWLTDTGVA
jgi:endo-1,4-beta-xylanase